jgi:excisionase family DNA binding protein
MDKLMTVPEIAARLRKAIKTIYHWIETERIPPGLIIRLGTSIRISTGDLEKWLESHKGI